MKQSLPAVPPPLGEVRRGLLLLILFLLAACSREDKAFVAMLDRADSLMQTHPDSALALLDAAGSQEAKKSSLSMRYWLLKADALNKTDAPLPSDTLMKEVVEYYDRHGNANERMRAHYLLGHISFAFDYTQLMQIRLLL